VNRLETLLFAIDDIVAEEWTALYKSIAGGVSASDVASTINDITGKLLTRFRKYFVQFAYQSHDESVEALSDGLTLVQSAYLAMALTEAEDKVMIVQPSKADVLEIIMRPNPKDGRGWESRLEGWSKKIVDKDKLKETLAKKYAAGAGVEEIARAIKPMVQGIGSSARRIANTEGMRIANALQDKVYEKAGDIITGFTRNEILDEVTRMHHRTLNGRVYGKDEVRPELPDEPNCRGWWTPILATDKELLKRPIKPKPLPKSANAFREKFDASTPAEKIKVVGKTLYDQGVKAVGKSPSWNDLANLIPDKAPKAARPTGRPLQRQMARQRDAGASAAKRRMAAQQRGKTSLTELTRGMKPDLAKAFREGYLRGLKGLTEGEPAEPRFNPLTLLRTLFEARSPDEEAAYQTGLQAGLSAYQRTERSLKRSAQWLRGFNDARKAKEAAAAPTAAPAPHVAARQKQRTVAPPKPAPRPAPVTAASARPKTAAEIRAQREATLAAIARGETIVDDTPESRPPETKASLADIQAMSKVKVTKMLPLNSGVNRSWMVDLSNGKQGIYKPDNPEPQDTDEDPPEMDPHWVKMLGGEKAVEEFPVSHREAAAAIVDRHLGYRLVPPTVVTDGPDGKGSLQEFATAFPATITPENQKKWKNAKELAIFDRLIGNMDRHQGNALTTGSVGPTATAYGNEKGSNLVAIDNGFSFLPQSKLDTNGAKDAFYNHLVNEKGEAEKPSPATVAKLKAFAANRAAVTKDLSKLMPAKAIDEMFVRADKLLKLIEDDKAAYIYATVWE
jgi:SPP1 gp7 family putative phage head morphogenesis protein